MNTIRTAANQNGVPMTSMLLAQAGLGAIGMQPTLGLSDDFDIAHRCGWTTPTVQLFLP